MSKGKYVTVEQHICSHRRKKRGLGDLLSPFVSVRKESELFEDEERGREPVGVGGSKWWNDIALSSGSCSLEIGEGRSHVCEYLRMFTLAVTRGAWRRSSSDESWTGSRRVGSGCVSQVLRKTVLIERATWFGGMLAWVGNLGAV